MKSLLASAKSFLLLLLLLDSNPNHAALAKEGHPMKLEVDAEFRNSFEETLLFQIDSPTDLDIYRGPDGDRLMAVTSKEGKLWIIVDFDDDYDYDAAAAADDERFHPPPQLALDIGERLCVNVERGLLGVAFHPDFDDNGWIYLYYTYNRDTHNCNADGLETEGPVNRLSRFELRSEEDYYDEDEDEVFDGYTASLEDELVLFDTPLLPYGDDNAGCIAFGNDGLLYVSVGDGGKIQKLNDDGLPYAQALDTLLGKILRLTDTGDIPPNNPFVDEEDSARCNVAGRSGDPKVKCREIFSYGWRNPFRFAMDEYANSTKDDNGSSSSTAITRFFVNDPGRHTWESIREMGDGFAGVNYGYPQREGPCKFKMDSQCEPDSDYVQPVHWFHHGEGGGDVVTAGTFVPNVAGWPDSFRDSYIYANYAFGGLYRIRNNGDGCPYPKCDPPISDYASSTTVLSTLKRVVSMKFGPYDGGRTIKEGKGTWHADALYVATRGDTGNQGTAGVYRIAYVDDSKGRSPRAVIDANVTVGFAPLTVRFDGTRSIDPDGGNDDVTYAWDFDGDGAMDSALPVATFTYEHAGSFKAHLTVRDSNGGSDAATVRIDVDQELPRAKISSPAEGTSFAVGDTFTLVGFATDAEGRDLPDASLLWEVRLYDVDEEYDKKSFRQFLGPTEGNGMELPGAPSPTSFDAAATSYLVVLLTVSDSRGLPSTPASVVLSPRTVDLTLDSVPSGLHLTANSMDVVTPATVTAWENQRVRLDAPTQTTVVSDDTTSGTVSTYEWKSWSDGGGRSHDYVAPSAAAADAASKERGRPAAHMVFAEFLCLTHEPPEGTGAAAAKSSTVRWIAIVSGVAGVGLMIISVAYWEFRRRIGTEERGGGKQELVELI